MLAAADDSLAILSALRENGVADIALALERWYEDSATLGDLAEESLQTLLDSGLLFRVEEGYMLYAHKLILDILSEQGPLSLLDLQRFYLQHIEGQTMPESAYRGLLVSGHVREASLARPPRDVWCNSGTGELLAPALLLKKKQTILGLPCSLCSGMTIITDQSGKDEPCRSCDLDENGPTGLRPAPSSSSI